MSEIPDREWPNKRKHIKWIEEKRDGELPVEELLDAEPDEHDLGAIEKQAREVREEEQG